MDPTWLRDTVARAIAEDIGPGDITTLACIDESAQAQGTFFARQELTLSGAAVLPVVYSLQGGVQSLELLVQDGARLTPGTPLAKVRGPARTLLTCERVALNFLQRLSGVATLASKYVDAVKGTKTRILDTRKTTPGLRLLEKAAAAAGGVTNHRLGLYDAVLIKNNHISAAGGVRQAFERAQRIAATSGVPIEVEVRTRAELDEALACGATRMLLDNLTPAEAREWITYIDGRASTELSGGITLETVRAYAEAGPDYISVGAITHSATAVDLNFRLELL
ncbi:MAG: carboxylating nicotinate-nucleotide diphosphorylase [Bryobacterales bacterium]|nr:carboxylating nicotinate-nucleotide diphosphorylase [Bryobacterales bacterium]